MFMLSGMMPGIIMITVVTGGSVGALIWVAIADGKRQHEDL